MRQRLIDAASRADGARGFEGNAIRVRPLLETSDVATLLGLTYAGVRHLVAVGQLTVWHRTLRGCKLFDPAEVARVLLARADRTRARREARLRRLDVPRRMVKAKAKGSSLQDVAANRAVNG